MIDLTDHIPSRGTVPVRREENIVLGGQVDVPFSINGTSNGSDSIFNNQNTVVRGVRIVGRNGDRSLFSLNANRVWIESGVFNDHDSVFSRQVDVACIGVVVEMYNSNLGSVVSI